MNGPDPAVYLTIADLQVDSLTNLQSFKVFIKCAKTNPFWQGCFIFLGCGSTSLCPVLALSNYLHLRGPGKGLPFIYQDGCPLSGACLSSFSQSTLQVAGILRKFSGQSFRIGVATTTAQQGTSDHLIKTMGRWSSEAYLLYVCTPVVASSQQQNRLHSRYDSQNLSLPPLSGCRQIWAVFLEATACCCHEPYFSKLIELSSEVMAELPGFAGHGRSLHLGAGCQQQKLLEVSGTQPPVNNAVVKCS